MVVRHEHANREMSPQASDQRAPETGELIGVVNVDRVLSLACRASTEVETASV